MTAIAGQIVDDRLALRNVLVLAAAAAIGGAGGPINVAASTIAANLLLGADKSWATLPVTTFVLGTALLTVPAALLMRRVGRRAGFVGGFLIGAAGAAMQAAAMFAESFVLLCIGAMLMGGAAAFVQQFRFAATDTASPQFRPKAISWVMLGGVLAAIVGPQTVIHTRDLLSPVPFAGAYVAAACLMLVGALIVSQVRIPKPVRDRQRPAGRPISQIAAQPAFIIAVGCSIAAYSMMSLVMTAAPLAMMHEGHHQDAATLGIQWHVIAMFAPSFVTGNLIARFGAERIVLTGLLLLVVCALVALAGVTVAHFWGALVLLGIGWNFGFVGGTSLVTNCYRPEEKETVQGFNDFLVFGSVAAASFLSGNLLVAGGWHIVTLTVLPVTVASMAALIWQMLRSPSAEAARQSPR